MIVNFGVIDEFRGYGYGKYLLSSVLNELYKKSKAEGLTPEEAKEQKILRKEYMELIRVNLRSQLNNIDMEQKDGSIVNLGEKYGEKYMNKKGN